MLDYERGDVATFYFIVLTDGTARQIRAWSDDKKLAQFYMEYHSCKNMTMKSITKRFDQIIEIIHENTNDEIGLYNIIVRDPDKKKKHQQNTKLIVIPATSAEMMFIREEGSDFMPTRVNYGYLNSALPYLKNKYQRYLSQLFLQDVIRKVVHNSPTPIVEAIQVDQLMVYLRSFPEQFG